MHDLYSGFYLTKNSGNNAFSFSERKNKTLFVPSCISGNISDLFPGKEIVFEEIDDEKIYSCPGLKNFITCEILGTPAVIFDNHNHAFYFWHEYFLEEKNPLNLVHIDQHSDMREPKKYFTGNKKNTHEIFQYTNEILNVGNFILPSVETGCIKNIFQITSEQILKDFSIPEKKYILDLDIDFFAPEMEVNIDSVKEKIQALAQKAKFITIATSPFFINQKLGIICIQKLFR